MNIRACEAKDLLALCEIYNHYIATSVITFEELPLEVDDMRGRLERVQQTCPWLVCEWHNEVVGFAYASTWKERSAYRHTAEVTVYVKHSCAGQSVGKALYSELLRLLASANVHVLLACIALPNQASVGLHEYFGFAKVAHFAEVGRKFNRWVDVGYWQKTLGHAVSHNDAL